MNEESIESQNQFKRRGVFLFSDREYGQVNRMFAEEEGLTEEEWVRRCEDFNHVPPEDRTLFPIELDDQRHYERFGMLGARTGTTATGA